MEIEIGGACGIKSPTQLTKNLLYFVTYREFKINYYG